jgi:SAM-dependent methyltransferase
VHTDLAKRVADEKAFHNARFAEHSGAETGSKYYLALQDWYSDYLRLVMHWPSRHVLELGSGVECLALQIDHADFAFDSIDISEEAISYAKSHARLPQARFSVDDAHHTRFPAGNFDLVIGRGILHHLDIPLACAEIKRVLQPGGKIVFGEPLDCNVLINLYRKLTPKIRSQDERPLSTEALALLRSHFGKLDITYYGFLTLGPAILRRRAPRWLHALDHFLLNTLGLGRFLAWACLISSPDTSS